MSVRYIAVLAQYHEDFIKHVTSDPKPARLFVHVKNPVDVEGKEFRRIVLLPGYDQVKDAQHLLNLATLRLTE